MKMTTPIAVSTAAMPRNPHQPTRLRTPVLPSASTNTQIAYALTPSLVLLSAIVGMVEHGVILTGGAGWERGCATARERADAAAC
ncbi:hypothetical protein GCM10009693_03660 [Leucobacter chromiireducens subsp. chromiireducens]